MTGSDEQGNQQQGREAPLNPTLTSRTENAWDLSSSPAPVETTSAREGGGEGWSIVWLLVVIVGVLMALFFIF